MASLFVIQGADQGRRFEIPGQPTAVGRDGSNPIRLHDNEVSRRHAELRPSDRQGFRLVDLGSANGTYVNGQPVDEVPLRTGDQVRIGRTLMLYSEGPAPAHSAMTERVDLLKRASPEDRSAIIKSIPAGEGSRLLDAPSGVGEWLKVRLANLAVMYQATQAVSHILDTDELLPRVLQLVFESIGADRAAVLMAPDGPGDGGPDPADGPEAAELVPRVVRWRGEAEPDERMTISRSIVDHVHQSGQGVISTDVPADERFAGESIVDYGIREAICVPIAGRHSTLGVLYADIRATPDFAFATDPGDRSGPRGKFSNDHLRLMVAIGHQAGLAIENTRFYEAKLQAERLAAVGQTIATLSHHVKNILQGLRGGSYLIDLGLNEKDEAIIRRGWAILDKNQTKIYNMVMDMLSFSKDREPSLEPADLNETVGDVVELMQSRADDLGVSLAWEPGAGLPEVQIDPEGIHRAVLNIVTNALDAAEDAAGGGRVVVATEWDAGTETARVAVADNGAGVPPEELPRLFQIFASTKGTRGTGLGLPVSQKIVLEHGGRIRVDSEVGRGSTFTVELPMRRPDGPLLGSSEYGTLA